MILSTWWSKKKNPFVLIQRTFLSFGTGADKFNPKERNCNFWIPHGQHSQLQIGKILNLNSNLYIEQWRISLLWTGRKKTTKFKFFTFIQLAEYFSRQEGQEEFFTDLYTYYSNVFWKSILCQCLYW